MEIREFAERVLFATTLEEKLQCPDNLTDEHPGPALVAPLQPGRPRGLQFKPHGSRQAEFPGLHQLGKPREQGKLLHFFANHELLATELMALVLLKFPDAPTAFRKGVLQTLKDEQAHTRLYIERMKTSGIGFGELPVSGYFWRCVAPMEHPIDYVSGLCLTFEQANLDFARHFARGFRSVGDTVTAKLLEKIYHDEIAHVAYGLKWFRRWKNPNESDWEAFCRTLKFPLSPQRAKGFTLNVEGRRAAGLDEEFIAELNVYSQSRGRTPSVHVFNPFAEGHIANGKTFNPTKHQAQLARDLENLPQFLCRQDDIVLVTQRPAVGFLSTIRQAGFALPEFVECSERSSASRGGPAVRSHGRFSTAGAKRALQQLASRKLGRLRPWAWSPDSIEMLAPLIPNVSAEQRTAEQRFNPGVARLYSKALSAELLRKSLASQSAMGNRQAAVPAWLCSENEVGVAVDSLDAALDTIVSIRKRGHHQIVVKQAIGLAGSNAIRLFEPQLPETHRRWMARTLAHGQQLVIEPWLERLMDFSVQLEITANGLKVCGYTGLLNDAKGQFQGNWAESHHHTRVPAKVVALFCEPADIAHRLLQLYADIFVMLEDELRKADYLGPVGIDALVYRDAAGHTRIKPIVEINPRYTMGRVLVELMRQTCQGCSGLFQLINHAALRAGGFEDFRAYARCLKVQFPLQLEGEPNQRIREGALCLNEPVQDSVSLAVFRVSRTVSALPLP